MAVDKRETAARIRELRREIDFHNHRYYVLDSPVVSDAAYDALFRELEGLERAFPDLVAPDSPTQRVGAPPLEAFASVEHALPMLSLANAMAEEEIVEFDARLKRFLKDDAELDYVVELKMDGLAVEVVFEHGTMVSGSTRGDGRRGEDVTLNLRTVCSLPLHFGQARRLASPSSHFAGPPDAAMGCSV